MMQDFMTSAAAEHMISWSKIRQTLKYYCLIKHIHQTLLLLTLSNGQSMQDLCCLFLPFKGHIDLALHKTILISLKTAVSKAPSAHAVDIELLPLIDKHTQEHTFGFILLTCRTCHLSGENFTSKKMLISQRDNSYFLFEMVSYAGGC